MTRSCRMATGAALAVSLASVGTLYGQDPAKSQDPQAPSAPFRAGVSVVRVDVSVSDRRDQAVDNLQALDFELREDGVPQRVDTAQFLRLDGTRASNTDESLAIRSQEHAATEAARDDVRVFAIFLDDYHVDKDQRLTMRVHQALTDLVKQFGPNDLVAIMDPLTPMSSLKFTRSREDLLARVNAFEGRRGQSMPVRSVMEEAQLTRNNVWEIRGGVSLTALEALVTYLGDLREGRKSVLFVSQGPNMGRDMANEGELQAVLKAANRGNVTINAFDPRPLGNGPMGGSDVIARLAGETGGRAVTNANDPNDRLTQTIADASAYYLLGYTPAHEIADGKFHRIEVKVKRSGMRVLARKGYWAASAEETKVASVRAAEPGLTDALAALVEPRAGRPWDVWVGMSRSDGGRTRMTVTWETSGRSDKPPTQLEVAPLDGGARIPGAEPRALSPALTIAPSATASFDLDPGTRVALRLGLKTAAGDQLDRWDQAIVVPALGQGALALSTPRFLRARSALEARTMAAGVTPVPAASRRFRVSDRVQVEIDCYVAGDPRPDLAAHLLNARGEQLMALTVVPTAASATVRVALPLSSLAVATYVLRLDARLGDRSVQDRSAFQIVP